MIAAARRLRSLALAVLLLGLAAPASALTTEEARTFLDDVAERATSILASDAPFGERREQLQRVLETVFDLDYIGRLVLGPTYRSLSADQQEAYDAAFEDYVLTTYSRRIDEYGGEQLEVVGATPAGSNDVKVETRVTGTDQGEPVRVDWRVRQRESGPQIIDVEIEGVSMAISQRSEFASVVDQRGVDGLIAMLEERAAAS